MGDSITEGTHTSNPPTDSYPAVLGRWLGTHYQVRNFGVSSSTVLNRGFLPYEQTIGYAQALALKPDIVVVALGTNDAINFDFDAPTQLQFQVDYKTLVTAFKAANAKVKVYSCLPPPLYGSSVATNDKLKKQILPLIRSAARAEGARVIDLNTLLSDHAELFPDGIHPDTVGTRIMAAEVYRVLTGKQAPA